MIECSHCKENFHGKCVGLTKKSAQGILYHCSGCLEEKKKEIKVQGTIIKPRTKKKELTTPKEPLTVNLNVI
jgi:hypothetical protein